VLAFNNGKMDAVSMLNYQKKIIPDLLALKIRATTF